LETEVRQKGKNAKANTQSHTFNEDIANEMATFWKSRQRRVVKVSIEYKVSDDIPLAKLERFSTIPPESRSENDDGSNFDLRVYIGSKHLKGMLPDVWMKVLGESIKKRVENLKKIEAARKKKYETKKKNRNKSKSKSKN